MFADLNERPFFLSLEKNTKVAAAGEISWLTVPLNRLPNSVSYISHGANQWHLSFDFPKICLSHSNMLHMMCHMKKIISQTHWLRIKTAHPCIEPLAFLGSGFEVQCGGFSSRHLGSACFWLTKKTKRNWGQGATLQLTARDLPVQLNGEIGYRGHNYFWTRL